MRLRKLGRTGLEISEIVFGAGAVGGAVFRGEREQRLETVRRALESGVNWIDTAPGYGNGESESNLGWILPELAARPHLSTKVRLAPADLDDIHGAVERSLRASLDRLGVGHVDLLQLHNQVGAARDEASGRLAIGDVLGRGGVADAVDAVRSVGRASHIGFTALGQVDVLHEIVASGRFDTAQVYHNILNPSATRAVPRGFSAVDYKELARACGEHGLGVLNIRVLAAGALGGHQPRGRALSRGSEPERDAKRASLVAADLENEPGSLPQKAIRFALGQPGISGVLVGFSNPGHVDDAVAATELPPLGPDAMTRLESLYASDFEGA